MSVRRLGEHVPPLATPVDSSLGRTLPAQMTPCPPASSCQPCEALQL